MHASGQRNVDLALCLPLHMPAEGRGSAARKKAAQHAQHAQHASMADKHDPACPQGTLPEAWGVGNAFPALRLLGLTKNWRIVGSLPASWGSNGTSMQRLEVRMRQT